MIGRGKERWIKGADGKREDAERVHEREKGILGADKQVRERRGQRTGCRVEDGNSGYQENDQGRVMKEGRRTMRGARARDKVRYGKERDRARALSPEVLRRVSPRGILGYVRVVRELADNELARSA